MRLYDVGFGYGVEPAGALVGVVLVVLVLLAVWSIFWNGLALWHSARREQPWWFVILLVVNTLGILEIIYLFGVAKIKPSRLFKKH